jgi:sialic acid synthase SpsE
MIGSGYAPYIIAELGVNHDGDPRRAMELTDMAAQAGADAIKLQLFEAERLMSRASRLAVYQENAGERDPVEMLRRLELSVDQMAPVVDLAHRRGIHAIVTVFSVELVEAAMSLPWDAFKTASPDIINLPLLRASAMTQKPLIVSTGASTLSEVIRAAAWLAPWHERVCLMQCVSSYPTPPGCEGFGGISAIAMATGLTVGYSDHTMGLDASVKACESGATILEKHLTYDRSAQGPDHAASLTPHDLAIYCRNAREVFEAGRAGTIRSTEGKHVMTIERDVRSVSRQSVVATRDLELGHVIRSGDVTIKRPGNGLAPYLLSEVISSRVVRRVVADTPLELEDLGWSQSLAAA